MMDKEFDLSERVSFFLMGFLFAALSQSKPQVPTIGGVKVC